MKCVLLGATQGCGLETLLNLTAAGHICYVLCRNPEAFNATLRNRNVDPDTLQPEAGGMKLINPVRGDAFQEADVRALFTTAGDGVDFVLFSLGGRPSFKNPFAPKLMPPAICSRTIAIFLPVFTSIFPNPSNQPRLVVISSSGLGAQGHSDLPMLLKPLYGWLLKDPHADKGEMERLVHAAAGIQHDDFNPTGENQGSLGNVVIIRPALLTDGVAKGTGALKKGDRVPGAWTISRKDVGLFIATECADVDSQWKGRGVTISY